MNKFRSFVVATMAAFAAIPLAAHADIYVSPDSLFAKSATPGCNAWGRSVRCDNAHGGGVVHFFKLSEDSQLWCSVDVTRVQGADGQHRWEAKIQNAAGKCTMRWHNANTLVVSPI